MLSKLRPQTSDPEHGKYQNISLETTSPRWDSKISVKTSQKVRCSREQENWRKWAENFINGIKKRITRLLRIIGTDSLDEVFGSLVTLDMLWPLRFRRLFHERLKKSSGANKRRPNNGNLKYGIRVPRNVKEVAQFNK